VWAHAANLTVANHVPVGRAARLLSDLLGVGCSVGFVAGVRGVAAGRLGPFMARVRWLLGQAGVLGVDETPGRAGGALAYVHVACTEFLTHLHVGGRSADDIDAGGVLPGYTGTIVRDGYAGYAHLSEALHAWCGAHGLRDLRAVWEADPAGQTWAQAMADLLVYANRAAGAARAAGAEALDGATLARIVGWYRGAVAKGIADNQRRRTQAAKDGLRLARRFDRHEAMILRFATDLSVGFTNNQSERDVRPVKVQQRASGGCWRTLQGLADFAVVQSYLSTAAKWGVDKLAALRQLFSTGPWLPPALSPG
jgi:transposase